MQKKCKLCQTRDKKKSICYNLFVVTIMGILKKVVFKVKKGIVSVMIMALVCLTFDGTVHAASKIKLNHSKVTMKKGETLKLLLKKAKKKKVKWSTNNKKVLKISKSGKIKALRVGTATVFAKYKKKKYKCKISITSNKESVKKNNVNSKKELQASDGVYTLKNIYVSNVIRNTNDWYVMINYLDTLKAQYISNSFQSFANATITLNGKIVEVSELKKGDILEIEYFGELSNDKYVAIPNIKSVKATR